MPESSMQSMRNCPFSQLPEDHISYELSDSNLRKAKWMIFETNELRKGKGNTLLVLDDLQSQYKDYEK